MRTQTVKLVRNVKGFLRSVLECGGVIRGNNLNKLTMEATGIGVTIIKSISQIDLNTYQTPTKRKINEVKNQFDRIDDFTRDLLRRTVFEHYRDGKSPTVVSLMEAMRQKTAGTDYQFPYGAKTLYRLLRSMGFKYRVVPRKSIRAESYHIIAWRYKYLETIKYFRSLGYADVYLDETWFDSNSCRMKNWTDDSENCVVTTPDNKGDRIVIVHCGGRSGFISDALLVTHTKMADAPADYHGSMKSDIFENWFEECLLKRLEEPSVIVLDNAPYHSRLLNPKPNSSWKKDKILQFMTNQNIPIPHPIPIVHVLLEIIDETLPTSEKKKKYVVDELAASYGHVVLRLPPYHCIFNPIEMVWSEIKRRTASNNLKKKSLEEIISILKNACRSVTPENWRNYIDHEEKIEDSYQIVQPIFNNKRRISIEIMDTSDEESDN